MNALRFAEKNPNPSEEPFLIDISTIDFKNKSHVNPIVDIIYNRIIHKLTTPLHVGKYIIINDDLISTMIRLNINLTNGNNPVTAEIKERIHSIFYMKVLDELLSNNVLKKMHEHIYCVLSNISSELKRYLQYHNI